MTSTSFNIGMSSDRSSSRVLKPPGGGHTELFGSSEAKMPSPRPKYDQQNSSNLNFCLNSTDANVLVDQVKQEVASKPAESKPVEVKQAPPPVNNINGNSTVDTSQQSRGNRVPPGGFSSGGFW